MGLLFLRKPFFILTWFLPVGVLMEVAYFIWELAHKENMMLSATRARRDLKPRQNLFYLIPFVINKSKNVGVNLLILRCSSAILRFFSVWKRRTNGATVASLRTSEGVKHVKERSF